MIRVGIDTTERNIGYCAPVFADRRFEYIPLPAFYNPTEEPSYGSIKPRNKEYGQFLSDFMHTDRHSFLDDDGTPYIFSVGENGQPLLAKDIAPHFDPEFVTNTLGIQGWHQEEGYLLICVLEISCSSILGFQSTIPVSINLKDDGMTLDAFKYITNAHT